MDFLGAEPPVDEPPSRMEGAIVVANPMIKVEIDYNILGLEKSKLILNTPRQSLMESDIDSWKKSLVDHVFFDHNGFRLLKRHFQLALLGEPSQGMGSCGLRFFSGRMPEPASDWSKKRPILV